MGPHTMPGHPSLPALTSLDRGIHAPRPKVTESAQCSFWTESGKKEKKKREREKKRARLPSTMTWKTKARWAFEFAIGDLTSVSWAEDFLTPFIYGAIFTGLCILTRFFTEHWTIITLLLRLLNALMHALWNIPLDSQRSLRDCEELRLTLFSIWARSFGLSLAFCCFEAFAILTNT